MQTLFYGVFSAWVKWCEEAPPISARFDWHAAAWTLHVPFIRSLYGMVAQPATLGPLGLTALVLLRLALDANYAAVAADTYPWPAAAGATRAIQSPRPA